MLREIREDLLALKKSNLTIEYISRASKIEHTRIWRIFNGYEIKLDELEKLEKAKLILAKD